MKNINKRKNILVVEDDPGIAELFKFVLEEQDHIVRISDNGEDALLQARGEVPDLVFLDLWIPKLSGENVARMLKIKEETKNVPVIIVSAQRDLSEITRKIGADGYLTKPFDIDNLIAIVDRFTSQAD